MCIYNLCAKVRTHIHTVSFECVLERQMLDIWQNYGEHRGGQQGQAMSTQIFKIAYFIRHGDNNFRVSLKYLVCSHFHMIYEKFIVHYRNQRKRRNWCYSNFYT